MGSYAGAGGLLSLNPIGNNPIINTNLPSTLPQNASSLSKSVGLGGNVAGVGNYPNPQMPGITSPVTPDQNTAAQAGVGNSIGAQNALLQALAQAGGMNGQQQVANGQQQGLNTALTNNNGAGNQASAYAQNQALASQIGSVNGLNQQLTAANGLNSVAGQQAATAAQLQGVANGTGPNPALAALHQATGQNVANQAALMAGQRGAGSNVGLIARQAAQQGAATQQQAVGQAATLQAQQQLGALSGLTTQQQAEAGTQQALGSLGLSQVGQQQTQLGNLANIAGQQVGAQQTGINSLYGQGATAIGQQQTQQQNIANNALQNQGQTLGALGQYNQGIVSGQSSVNSGNTQLNNTSMQGRQAGAGGLFNAAGAGASAILGGSALSGTGAALGAGATGAGVGAGAAEGVEGGGAAVPMLASVARGGYVSRMADGGETTLQSPMVPSVAQQAPNGPASPFGQFLTQAIRQNAGMARGGIAQKGGAVDAKNPAQKATKSGNSYANDKVPALLSEGEVVIPRSVMQSGSPERGAADFVRKVLAHRGRAS
jgi:hypothetical protein